MDIQNLWGDNTPRNIVKTFLCGGTDGQTYTLSDNKAIFDIDTEAIRKLGYDYDWADIETEFDEIVGFRTNYKIDDPDLDSIADRILKGLADLSKEIAENPSKFFRAANKDKDLERRCQNALGVTPSNIVDHICMGLAGMIPSEYAKPIAEKCVDFVVDDIIETADPAEWSDSDLNLAFGRALVHHLGIEI